MIPKIIHYCWFGRTPLPDSAKEYILGWRKYCPDYRIIEWNEDTFDIQSNAYVTEAYNAKKWAFVTDYVRLYVLFYYGGIYMDVDVEVLKNLDKYLHHAAFSGFESNNSLPTGIIGAEKKHPWIKELLSYYTNTHFLKDDGTYDLTTNVVTIMKRTQVMYPELMLNNTYQEVGDGVVFYPSEYFCPIDPCTMIMNNTNNTVTIHHFAGSWISAEEARYVQEKLLVLERHRFLKKILSPSSGLYPVSRLIVPALCTYKVWGMGCLFHRILDYMIHVLKH